MEIALFALVVCLLIPMFYPVLCFPVYVWQRIFPYRPKSIYVPYDSFEFAGLQGKARIKLEQSRQRLLKDYLTNPDSFEAGHLCQLVVLSETLCQEHLRVLTALRMTEDRPAVIHLKTGERFLSTISNGVVTDVEGYWDGIPFGLEDIARFEPTVHYVTLKLMQHRSEAIKQAGLFESMLHKKLAPGNYDCK